MNTISDSHKRSLDDFRRPRDSASVKSRDPDEVYKGHLMYEEDSVLKSGILQMSRREVASVNTESRARYLAREVTTDERL